MLISLQSDLAELITSGSDNRLICKHNGLNGYGCSALPRDVIALGSCTCSSPTHRGITAAERTLETLRNADAESAEAFHDESERLCQSIRDRLAKLLQIPESIDIALTPSGTDVELLALALTRLRARRLHAQQPVAQSKRGIVNIVVGPSEVGSGTPIASAGQHYDTLLPSGQQASCNEPVCQSLCDDVDIQTVDVRDAHGQMLPESMIDSMVIEIVGKAIDQEQHVLLHIVAQNKTGMHAPTLDCVTRITRDFPDDVTVVVDAAQGRISRQGLREALKRNYLVFITGSKFYGGPPFAGCLMVPPALQPRPEESLDEKCWPAGLADYLTAAEVPPHWRTIRERLGQWINVGAMLRWSAALEEIQAYYDVSDHARLKIMRCFEAAVPETFSQGDGIELMPVFAPIEDPHQERLLESKTTVFGFRVRIDGKLLDRATLRKWHQRINLPIETTDSPDRSALEACYHLGQPVPFADGSSALRIALGGAMIVRIATDESIGNDLTARLDWLKTQLLRLRTKLQYLIAEANAIEAAN